MGVIITTTTINITELWQKDFIGFHHNMAALLVSPAK